MMYKLSVKTGISTGSLSGIYSDLRPNDFLGKDEQTGWFSFTNELELVKRFAYAYLHDVSPKFTRGLFYLLADDTLNRIREDKADGGILLGGQHAAAIRGNYLSSPAFNLYTDVRISDLARNTESSRSATPLTPTAWW